MIFSILPQPVGLLKLILHFVCTSNILRVSEQNGVSRQYIIVEIYHSGQKPSI